MKYGEILLSESPLNGSINFNGLVFVKKKKAENKITKFMKRSRNNARKEKKYIENLNK